MLFDSTVRKELARSFAATLMVILTIFMTNLVIRTLGLAANGAVAPQDVVFIFTLLGLQTLPTILSLSLFIGVILTLGRMYRESEMAIWFSSGIGLARFVRPVVATSWPIIVLIGILMLFVWPWSYSQYNDLRQRFEQRADVLRDNPFRIGDGYVAEGEVWRRIGRRYRTRYVNVPVLACRTTGADRLTRLPFSAVAAGMVNHHVLVLTEDIRWLPHHPTAFVRAAGNLVRGQLHLGVPVHRQPRPLTTWRARLLWAACLPCGWVLYRRDRARQAPSLPTARPRQKEGSLRDR